MNDRFKQHVEICHGLYEMKMKYNFSAVKPSEYVIILIFYLRVLCLILITVVIGSFTVDGPITLIVLL